MKRATFILAFLMAPIAQAEPVLREGSYLCTAEQRAGVGSTHLEGAPPPTTYAARVHYRFRIAVTRGGARYRVVEAPYNGPEASQYQWEDDNSTLHADYVGDGSHFAAVDGHGFLDFAVNRWGPGVQFYHAGYEYAGGEDESLSVRWGRCVREAQ